MLVRVSQCLLQCYKQGILPDNGQVSSQRIAAVLLQSRRTLSVAAPGHSGTAEIVTSIDVL
jgi:hypothetical protein